MLCLFPARWEGDEGQKPQMICKQPDKTINIKYERYLVRSGKKILTSQNDDNSDKNIKHGKKLVLLLSII